MIAELAGTLIASVYGSCTFFRKKTPLFYKIVFFSVVTCLIGNIYTALYEYIWQPVNVGFHIGYLGYTGMFFFLYSSYYGALDSLADGKEPELRRFRLAAGTAAAGFFASAAFLMHLWDRGIWMYIVVIPMSMTMYFAVKHLIIPDIEMGIIRVMRPYNALIIGLCISMMLRIVSVPESMMETISSICAGILLAVCLPAARNGVRKWFI